MAERRRAGLLSDDPGRTDDRREDGEPPSPSPPPEVPGVDVSPAHLLRERQRRWLEERARFEASEAAKDARSTGDAAAGRPS